MKIAYFASFGTSYFGGVARKISSQLAVWNSLPDVQAELFCRAADVDSIPKGHRYQLKGMPTFNYDSKIIQDIRAFGPDVIYLREEICGPQVLSLLHTFPGKIVMEVNSNIDEELKLEGATVPRRRIAYYFNKLTYGYLQKHLSGCVCVSSEFLDIFPSLSPECKMVSPNGVDLSNASVLKKELAAFPEKPALLFVGTPGQKWHGIDLLFALAKAMPECVFHIVGPEQISDAPANMIFHGYLSGGPLENLYARSHVGIGTLALFRKKFSEACPLKVRDYLAAGLPVILGYQDSVFLDEAPPWVLQLPSEEKMFEKKENVDAVRAFVMRYAQYSVSHKESARFIDAAMLEKKKIQWLARLMGKDIKSV